ncbi:MAG: cell division protein FtsQ/DivIB [Alphaproteobacteria bacterium]|nr:cell division protein FtsQ/DivIB [Alphaproteobacteria bacterium]
MARKQNTVSPRQRQSQQIMREKAAKKRREGIRRKCHFIGGALLGVLVVGGGGLSWYSGAFSRTMTAVENKLFAATAQAGFAVHSLHVEGRSRTPMADIQQALGVHKNDPILQLSLEDMRERLQSVHSIREAAVDRTLPDALYIRIVEREPVALWQNQGELSLVDDKGVVMQGIDIEPYRKLPLIVGDGAPSHIGELMQIMAASPELASRFASAIRVGDRRWNIRLQNDIEVKLPEEGAAGALARLMEMDKAEQILARDIKVIDLRVPDRVFIKLSPELTKPAVIGTKET